MKPSRVAKLERQVRSRPCPGCGRAFEPPRARNDEVDFERLTGHEQAELAALIRATLTPPCRRCRRSGYTLTGLSDEQLGRALELLHTALGREMPAARAATIASLVSQNVPAENHAKPGPDPDRCESCDS